MASSSSSSNKYDVFLSFRGEDTRETFTSHLDEALRQKQIETFIDNELVRGDEISPALLNAIKQSKIAVVILSETYASSRWCLKELAKILKRKNTHGQIVIPVFYGVDPSDVRNQTGNFGDGFSKLEERFMERVEKLQKWRKALTEVANVSGFDSHVIRPEAVLVKKIVEDILKRLDGMSPNKLDKNFVGIESRIKEIESLLSDNSIDVYTLGIWGIGGIGKTTIASVIFNKFSSHFDGSCFIQNIREESEKNGGLVQLRREFFFTLLGDENLNNGIPNFNFARRRINRKKVMVVFDDVTDFTQIKFLIENLDDFGIGSLIIITTRNKQVLRDGKVKIEYEMKELKNDDALKLFCRRAFNGDQPNVGYEKLSLRVMQYCHGVPLALEVLGRFLYRRSKEEWTSAIKKLKKFPHSNIQKVLEISYGGLENEQKNIFLDIACFLKGEDRDFAIKFLDACGFCTQIELAVLEDKCLIKLSGNWIIMHDLLQEMGKEIVRKESVNDFGKRSRLWHPEEICEVFKENTGTEAIQGISLNMFEVKEEINLNFDIFKKMSQLRFLKFYGPNKFKIHDFKGLGYIFRKLRYLQWDGYPLQSLPQNMRAENLVFLRLYESKIEQLWNGVQNLVNLKEIDLSYSYHLTKLPDLSKAQNLERLDLQNCKSLNNLPSSIGSKSLKTLLLSDCSNLKRLPEILSCNLTWLGLDGTGIEELPSSFCKLKSLKSLCLVNCPNLRRLPDELGNLEALEDLYIERTLITEVPKSISFLSNLQGLYLWGLRGHKQNGFISSISASLVNLIELSLVDCDITEVPESLGQLSSLQILDLSENNFERIPESIINLSELGELYLSYCQRLQSLPKLPCSLFKVYANNCTSLESLSSLAFFVRRPFDNDFTNCYKLKGDEVRKFFEESLQKFQMEIPHLSDGGNITFPGSEIPEWFKNQSTGSSITLELPPTHNRMSIDFTFCLIVFGEHCCSDSFCHVFYNLKFKTVDGNRHIDHSIMYFVTPGNFGDSEHVILGHTRRNMLSDFTGKFGDINEVSIQFYLEIVSLGAEKPVEKRVDCCKWLKKCGIHLLYDQNYGESTKDCSTSFNIIDEEETDYSTSFKRRRIG